MSDLKDLADYSESDLYGELNRRAKEKKEKAKKERKEHNTKVLEFLRKHPEALSLFDHDRTSCKDDSIPDWGLVNGWYTSDGESPRCNKCAILEAVAGDDDHSFKIRFLIDLEKSYEE